MLTVKGRHVGFKFKFNLGKSIKSSKESGGGQAGGGPIDCGIGAEGVQEAGYKWARGGVLKGGKWEKWRKFLKNKDAYYFAIEKGLKAGRW